MELRCLDCETLYHYFLHPKVFPLIKKDLKEKYEVDALLPVLRRISEDLFRDLENETNKLNSNFFWRGLI